MTESDRAGSAFWRFSLDVYRRPHVAPACLALQDDAGADVNLLLFLLWQAAQRRVLAPDAIAALEARIRPWREMTVIPLRALRRALKAPPALVDAAAAEAYRSRIKAAELEAERLQQEAMAQLAGVGMPAAEAGSVALAAQQNLSGYETLLSAKFPPGTATILIEALGE